MHQTRPRHRTTASAGHALPSTCCVPDAQRTQVTPGGAPGRRPRPSRRVGARETGRRAQRECRGPQRLGFRLLFVSPLCGDRRPRWLEDWACLGSRASRGSCRSLRRSDQPRPSRRRRGQDSSPHIPRPRGRSGDWTPGDAKAPPPRASSGPSWESGPRAASRLGPGCPAGAIPTHSTLALAAHPAGASPRLSSCRNLHVTPPGSERDGNVSPLAPRTHGRALTHGRLRLAQGAGSEDAWRPRFCGDSWPVRGH